MRFPAHAVVSISSSICIRGCQLPPDNFTVTRAIKSGTLIILVNKMRRAASPATMCDRESSVVRPEAMAARTAAAG